jgi:hypothetical protein
LADTQEVATLAGLSLKTLLAATIGILLFGIYVGVLIYGENSLSVLQRLKKEKSALRQQARVLKIQNQKLQKEYFELKQLEPKE